MKYSEEDHIQGLDTRLSIRILDRKTDIPGFTLKKITKIKNKKTCKKQFSM